MESIYKLNTLVVEDHAFQLDYLSACLNQLGIEDISQAQDGIEALAAMDNMAAENKYFDVILCDLQMPNMDGIEFIRHLADREFEGALILLTAMDASLVSSITKMACEYKLNFIGSLIKPVDIKTLVRLMAEAVSKHEHPLSIKHPLPKGVEEADLIDALESSCLQAHFQPKFRFDDGRLMGFEALARLKLKTGQLALPDDFFHLYAQLGKTEEYEMQIYRQSFQYLAELIEKGHRLELSINYGASMLGSHRLYNRMTALVDHYKIPHELITIEITERSLINSVTQAIEFLARLRINGFKVALDDFGTGYSSMKQLEILPFNELKIDKSFLIGIENDEQKQAIVQSTTELAERLNLTVTVEGIENEAAWVMAKKFGCDICQGFYTGEPALELAV